MEEKTNPPPEIETLKLVTEFLRQYEFSKEMYKKMLAEFLRVLDLDIGTLRVIDEDSGVLRLVASAGVEEDQLVQEVSLDDSEHLGASVGRGADPIVLSDAVSEGLPGSRLDIIEALGIRTLIFWPIKGANGRMMGVVNLASRHEKQLDVRSRDLFSAIARAFGAVMERHVMVQALKKSEE
ncbi:GAF domain-containing protein, partial [Candidatus Thorarchaeota archaeon]